MPLFSVEVKLCATAYIKATSKAEALRVAKWLKGQSPMIHDADGDVAISGLGFSDPDLPDVSLSPAMTIHGPWSNTVVERAD